MRYELKRNTNGQIQQCDNADGNDNVYAKRPELRKLALENLDSGMSGKLGDLNNLRVFNFQLSAFATGTDFYVDNDYNTSTDFPSAVSDCLMFGVDSLSGKASYYNIVSLNAHVSSHVNGSGDQLANPSFITFYLLQNIETSGTSSTGTKIPHPSSQLFTSGGTVSSSFNGNIFGNERVSIDLFSDVGSYAQNNNTKGLRCSGIALSEIVINFTGNVALANLKIDVEILVDTSSVSSSY